MFNIQIDHDIDCCIDRAEAEEPHYTRMIMSLMNKMMAIGRIDVDHFKRVLSVSLTSSRQSCNFTKGFLHLFSFTTCFDNWCPVHVVVFQRQRKLSSKQKLKKSFGPRK